MSSRRAATLATGQPNSPLNQPVLLNVAVIVAAGLVAWTGSAWPDLTVAAVIAVLFLHSAYEILRGARAELREQVQAS